jgi:tetratricopeptide (TPR) repeat protein
VKRTRRRIADARLLVALLIALIAGRAAAAPRQWWRKDWSYRKVVEVGHEQRWADAQSAWVSVGTGGHARPDGADIRVVTTRGEVLPHAVLGLGPGDLMEIAFLPKGDGPFHVYYGNPEPSRPRDPWRPERGLVLETRRRGGGTPSDLAAMRAIVKASPRIDGASRWPRVFDAVNPFGPDDDFVSIYRGKILVPRDGTYTFLTASDEASFLLIDGKEIVKWPGWHTAQQGAWARYKGQVQLTKGLHDFEYLHVERKGPQAMAAYWKLPGAAKATVIPETAFPGLRDAVVVACERYGSDVAADFTVQRTGKYGFSERVLTGLRLWARETAGGEPVKYRWSFGDGTTGRGPAPEHVYLHGGLFAVKLEVRGPAGADTATRVLYVPGDWTRDDRNRDALTAELLGIVRTYAWAAMDELSVRVGEFILKEARESEALLRLYREVVTTPNPALRKTDLSRMALALGDLERDVSRDFEAAVRAYTRAGAAGRRQFAASRVRIATAIVALKDDPKPAVDLLEELLDGGDLWRDDRRLAWIALGEARMALRQADEARAALAEARRYSGEKRLGADRVKAGAASRKATTHMRAKKWQEALDEIDVWEDLDPPARLEGFSTVLRAECEIALGRHDAARKRLKTLLALDPRSNYAARALWLKAASLEATGDRTGAIETFDRIAADHRDSPLAEGAAREAARLRGE